MAEDLGFIVGRIIVALVLGAVVVWVFVFGRSRDPERARSAAFSWRTVVAALVIMILSVATRIGDS